MDSEEDTMSKHLNAEHVSALAAILYPHANAYNRVVDSVRIATELAEQSKEVCSAHNKEQPNGATTKGIVTEPAPQISTAYATRTQDYRNGYRG